MSDKRYVLASEGECGVMYRPDEVDPGLNHCRLDLGHGGEDHSTRRSKHEIGGFEWVMRAEPSPVDWPSR